MTQPTTRSPSNPCTPACSHWPLPTPPSSWSPIPTKPPSMESGSRLQPHPCLTPDLVPLWHQEGRVGSRAAEGPLDLGSFSESAWDTHGESAGGALGCLLWEYRRRPPGVGISGALPCRFLGTSGQNVSDIFRYSSMEDHLEILEWTLRVRHISPTAPDTLGNGTQPRGLRPEDQGSPDWGP